MKKNCMCSFQKGCGAESIRCGNWDGFLSSGCYLLHLLHQQVFLTSAVFPLLRRTYKYKWPNSTCDPKTLMCFSKILDFLVFTLRLTTLRKAAYKTNFILKKFWNPQLS